MRLLFAVGWSLLVGLPLAGQSVGTAVFLDSEGESEASVTVESTSEDSSGVVSYVFTVDAAHEGGTLQPVVERRGGDFVLLEPSVGEPLALPRGRRGYLGVHVVAISAELRSFLGAEPHRGVLVSRVVESSPAAAAGIAVGDVLLAVDGEPIVSEWDLKRWIAPKAAAEVVRLSISRDGATWTLEAILESRRSRTLDLAPLIRSDQRGRTVLVAPVRRWQSDGRSEDSQGSLRFDNETTVHLETAFGEVAGALRDQEFNEMVGAELDERRALEERIRYLEQRLREIEAQLEAEDQP